MKGGQEHLSFTVKDHTFIIKSVLLNEVYMSHFLALFHCHVYFIVMSKLDVPGIHTWNILGLWNSLWEAGLAFLSFYLESLLAGGTLM